MSLWVVEKRPKVAVSEVVAYFLKWVDFIRFAKLVCVVGKTLDKQQFRMLKALFLEVGLSVYSNGKVKYIGEVGCDFILVELMGVRVEMKFVGDAIFSKKLKTLKKNTTVKLMNTNGTNNYDRLPLEFADFLLVISTTGALLIDKETVEQHLKMTGDGIIACFPTKLGQVFLSPKDMCVEYNSSINVMELLMKLIIRVVKMIS